jgi:ABC-type multidrug transport system fused ATPase/permease subunit
MALSASVTALSALLLFGVGYVQGEELTLPKVFYALALLALPRLYFDFFFLGVSAVSEMMVCVRRIGVFLALEEPPAPWHALKEHQPDDDEDVDVCIEKCDFYWNKVLKEEEQPTLKDITFKAHIGQLVAVVGSVGAGKSSLLAACLGEMIPSSVDAIKIRGPKVAYTSQSPWIISGTVQDNILFGLPYNEDRYNRVVEGAALRSDLATLHAGDQTELGERGINLSGGQKARVELARAAYSDAAVWLLDDPLSAVDPAVGKHIFERLLLSTKNSTTTTATTTKAATKVLVTHQKQYLPRCDVIYVLREGRMSHRGTYDELAALGIQEVLMTGSNDGDNNKVVNGNLTPTISAVFDTIDDDDDDEEEEEKDGTSHHQKEEASMMDGTTSTAPPLTASMETKNKLNRLTSRYLRRFVSGQLNHQISTEDDTNDGDGEGEEEGNTMAATTNNKAIKAKLKAGKSGKLIVGEDRATGSVPWTIYYKYWSLMGMLYVIIMCTALLGGHGVLIYSEYWLAQWASSDDQQDGKWLWVYGVLAAIIVSMALLRSLLFFWRSLRASSILHNSMLSHVLGSPLSFFHTNPTGRILNRLTRDQGIGDEVLPQVTWDAVQSVTAVSGALLLLAIVIPVILPIFIPLLIVFVIIRRRYLYSSREIKRYEATTRSPVYASFSAILKGLPSIRAYGVHAVFKDQFLKDLNDNSSWWYCVISSARWIGFRLDTIVAILLTAAPLLIMALRDEVSAKLAGLALTQSLGLAGLLQWAVRQTAEVENNMTSIERMFEYGGLDQEEDVLVGERKNTTPTTTNIATVQDSSIEYNEVTAVYRPGLPAVLKSITFTIRSGSRVGIAGRTGGGKSSLLLTLLRLIPVTQGTIQLGGVNIISLPLDVLRTLIFIIPQIPTLFSGSLRSNLDPYNKHDDAALWEVLHKVKLAEKITKIRGLGAHISDAGDNLSSGERQLLVLARSLLQDSTRILAMDEATSSIDKNTDQAIQGVIRETIGTKTLLVIAHRIDTILDSDIIMVLNKGQLAECGEPSELLRRQNGAFSGIVRAAQRKGGLIS